MQFSRSAVCFLAVLVFLSGLVISSVSAQDGSQNPINRLRRSVNFTPSWGKRSGGSDSGKFDLYILKYKPDFSLKTFEFPKINGFVFSTSFWIIDFYKTWLFRRTENYFTEIKWFLFHFSTSTIMLSMLVLIVKLEIILLNENCITPNTFLPRDQYTIWKVFTIFVNWACGMTIINFYLTKT
jgi:hypothetical protein